MHLGASSAASDSSPSLEAKPAPSPAASNARPVSPVSSNSAMAAMASSSTSRLGPWLARTLVRHINRCARSLGPIGPANATSISLRQRAISSVEPAVSARRESSSSAAPNFRPDVRPDLPTDLPPAGLTGFYRPSVAEGLGILLQVPRRGRVVCSRLGVSPAFPPGKVYFKRHAKFGRPLHGLERDHRRLLLFLWRHFQDDLVMHLQYETAGHAL